MIKRLLKKCYGRDFALTLPNTTNTLSTSPNKSNENTQNKCTSDGQNKIIITGDDIDYDALNDSDSAIMLEDHLTEVRKVL